MKGLVDKGNTLLIIEHNLDVIASSDYVIDVGPGGGKNGGLIVGTGTPIEISNNDTPTGRVLKEYFDAHSAK